MSQANLNAYALIIGIGAYHNINSLKKTTTDAQDLRDVLLERGYSKGNIVLLLDDQATKAAINQHLNQLAQLAKDDTTVLIFFAGHGAQWVGGFHPGEYLCPVGAIQDNLKDTTISNDELTTALNAISSQRMVVFLDACHSGGVVDPQQRGALEYVEPGLSANAYNQLSASKGHVVIASCQPDEVSWELVLSRRQYQHLHRSQQAHRLIQQHPCRQPGHLHLHRLIPLHIPQHRPPYRLLHHQPFVMTSPKSPALNVRCWKPSITAQREVTGLIHRVGWLQTRHVVGLM